MDADHDSYQDILKDLKLLVGGHLGVLHKLFCFARSQNFGTQETDRKEPTESKRERTSKKIVRDSERESVSQEEDKQAPASSKANAKRNGEHCLYFAAYV